MTDMLVQRSYRVRVSTFDLSAVLKSHPDVTREGLVHACTLQADKNSDKMPHKGILYLVKDQRTEEKSWTTIETVSLRDPDLKILQSVQYLVEAVSTIVEDGGR